VRYLWNAAAMTQMAFFGIPWGGSLAIRLDVIARAGLLDVCANSFCEDTSCPRPLKRLGLKVHHVPAVLINHEMTPLNSCLVFIRQQLICLRRHHPSWRVLLALNLALGAALPVAGVWGVVAALGDDRLIVGCLAADGTSVL
jgi:hypothetical protein